MAHQRLSGSCTAYTKNRLEFMSADDKLVAAFEFGDGHIILDGIDRHGEAADFIVLADEDERLPLQWITDRIEQGKAR